MTVESSNAAGLPDVTTSLMRNWVAAVVVRVAVAVLVTKSAVGDVGVMT